ncbi:MAG: serine/threonine protein kinase [Deltaproteobacteria bacterium]|nr:serine/threonine protein kinase [Deltaproteobacteria bacterium]
MTRPSLGPYQIVRRLGHGGMAEVFLAIAHGAAGFARQVAIKTLLPALQGDPALERALVHEARLAGALAHRNLVSVLGLGVDDSVTYVVMEYVDGADLARLARGAMPLPLALLVAEELALGLDHLHRAVDDRGLPLGLVHRDVSPSNVLVSRAGEIKLGDFGIAKATALADLTGGTRKGKYAYMSPEQLVGEPLTGASDQFALAVTLVELATGSRPFAADTPLATMDNVRRGQRPDLATLPAAVAALILRALAVDPQARFASSEALRGAIAAARRELPPVALPELAAWVAAALA